MKCGLVQLSWLIHAGGWLWAVTGSGPSTARRVLQSQEHLQQPSGEENVSPPRIFFTNPLTILLPPVHAHSFVCIRYCSNKQQTVLAFTQ